MRATGYGVKLATNPNNYAHRYLLVILFIQIISNGKQGSHGQVGLNLCLLGALKTMLCHGRKTSLVSSSAYILGGNLSGVCAGAADPDMITSSGLLDTRAVLMHVPPRTLPCYDSSLSRQPSLSALGRIF